MRPQSAGLVLGRADLIRALPAVNGAPNHSIGRPMKVGKEEMVGMLAAVEWSLRTGRAGDAGRLRAAGRVAIDRWPGCRASPYPRLPYEAGHADAAPTSTSISRPAVAREDPLAQLRAGDPIIEGYRSAGRRLRQPPTPGTRRDEQVADALNAILCAGRCFAGGDGAGRGPRPAPPLTRPGRLTSQLKNSPHWIGKFVGGEP